MIVGGLYGALDDDGALDLLKRHDDAIFLQ